MYFCTILKSKSIGIRPLCGPTMVVLLYWVLRTVRSSSNGINIVSPKFINFIEDSYRTILQPTYLRDDL